MPLQLNLCVFVFVQYSAVYKDGSCCGGVYTVTWIVFIDYINIVDKFDIT